jgi:hypothetical protein
MLWYWIVLGTILILVPIGAAIAYVAHVRRKSGYSKTLKDLKDLDKN